MLTRRNFTQQITSETQKLLRCCGQSLQFATASLWLSALSHQVSFGLICTKTSKSFSRAIDHHVLLFTTY